MAPGRGPGPAAHRRARGARRGLDPAARPARRGVRAGVRRHAAGLPVEPAAAGGRGGAERPRRRAAGARRRVRAAGAGRPGQGDRGGLAQRRQGAGARRAAGARADRHLGRAAALVRLRRPGRAGARPRPGRGGCCATAPRSPRPAGGPTAALSVLRKSLGDAPITEAVEEGTRWLEEFHPRSVVELDYGGLVDLLSGRRLWPRTTRPAWWRPGCPRCPGATPRRPPRRTRSWSPGGARSSFSSGATDLRKWDETGASGSAPKANTLRNRRPPKRDNRTKRDTIWRRKHVKIGHASSVHLGTFGRSAHVGHRGLAGP